MKIVGGILAGGRGRRMEGIDKPFAQLARRPLIAHVIERLAAETDGIVINANTAPERFAAFGLDVVPDSFEGYRGPLAGVHALMRATEARGASHVLIVPADTPFLPRDLRARLAGASADPTVVRIAMSNGRRHPVAALWPAALADPLGEHLASTTDLSMEAFLRLHSVTEAEFEEKDGCDPFFNVNSPTDLAHAEQLVAGAADRAE